ncbi:hypothetical protein ACQJBY_061072 [Aegilops geniculata]
MCRFEGRASFGCSGRKPCSGLGRSRRRRRLWAPHTFLEASSFEGLRPLLSHSEGNPCSRFLERMMAALRCRGPSWRHRSGMGLAWESHRLGWCAASGPAWKSERRLRISLSWRGAGIGHVGDSVVGQPGARSRGRRGCRSGGSGYGGWVLAPVARVAKLAARMVRGLGVGVCGFCLYVGAAAPEMVVGCRLRLLGQQSRRLD